MIAPYYQDDAVTLYHGDCREIMPELKGIDAIVSDPPYGIGFVYKPGNYGKVNTNNIGHANSPIIGDDKPFDPQHIIDFAGMKIPVVLCGANNFARRLPEGGNFLCWDKACGQGPAANFIDAEFIWSNRRNARNVFHFFWMGCFKSGEGASSNSKNKRLHVSQKPVELMMWLLATCRIGLGKTVLDPYMGSGSTGVACVRTGRKFVGIEIDEGHCEVAAKRLQAEVAK